MSMQTIIEADCAFLESLFAEQGRKAVLQAYEQSFVEAHRHGHYQHWCSDFDKLPDIHTGTVHLHRPWVTIDADAELAEGVQRQLTEACQGFIPWRKGPFNLYGVEIDTEWRSDMKWARLENHIDCRGKRILDVGCGNGYYAWRMLGAGAHAVLGIDPYVLFWFQYLICARYIPQRSMAVLPMPLEQLPEKIQPFDLVFSMGVLYHRRSPIEHLDRLRNCLQSGGELVLETLVTAGDVQHCLCPQDHYANMSNVWFLPSCAMLERWLERCKFIEIRKIDDSLTTPEEQRTTDWMPFHSLSQALNAENRALTVEGYPAPRRVVYTARKK